MLKIIFVALVCLALSVHGQYEPFVPRRFNNPALEPALRNPDLRQIPIDRQDVPLISSRIDDPEFLNEPTTLNRLPLGPNPIPIR